MGHRLTLVCDICDEEYLMGEDMELPPYWLGLQLVVSDQNGFVPTNVTDIFIHICSAKCLAEVSEHSKIKERIALIDKISSEEEPDEDR